MTQHLDGLTYAEARARNSELFDNLSSEHQEQLRARGYSNNGWNHVCRSWELLQPFARGDEARQTASEPVAASEPELTVASERPAAIAADGRAFDTASETEPPATVEDLPEPPRAPLTPDTDKADAVGHAPSELQESLPAAAPGSGALVNWIVTRWARDRHAREALLRNLASLQNRDDA